MEVPVELEGQNLGEKHQQYNKLLKQIIANQTCEIDEFDIDEGDIKNLLKIDIACKKRDVNYVIKVLTCNDILYVSRVVKRCHWLITDVQYSNIINPENLYNTLFPQMNAKSIIKFTKYIQLNIKDTTRAEQFYEYEKYPEKAVKWLPRCSSEFILQNIHKHADHLKLSLIRRLCEKNIMILEILVKTDTNISKSKIFEVVIPLLNHKNINKYLDLLEKLEYYYYPKFSKSNTSLIMKLASKRIFDKFENYCYSLHLTTFIKFLQRKNIKKFLLEQAFLFQSLNLAEHQSKPRIFDKNKITIFIASMPIADRFDFIRQVFIDKTHEQKTNLLSDSEIKAMGFIYNCLKNKHWFSQLQLYQYAPFDVAFSHIKKLINQETETSEKISMFSTLIVTANQNNQNINLLLQYFQDNHLNDQIKLRYQFIKDIICQTNFHKFDQNMWNVVKNIMMQDSVDSDKEYQIFIDASIVYYVLNSQSIPKFIEMKFNFNSLNEFKNRLNIEDKDLLFNYLYNYIKTKLEYQKIETEEELKETIEVLNKTLNLLNDWDKDLREYPFAMNKIKELIHIKKQSSWKPDLSFLYNKNKSWKKWLFEESFELYPCESVFMNAIKHDVTMFQRYKSQAEELCLDEKETNIQFLRKIKIYWSLSLTKTWTELFIKKLNILNNQKASAQGICILSPRSELLAILNKYAPENPKIDYGNINELNLNLQRCFAKNMHIARPQPPPETILLYATGDYLKCSLPSLLSIYHNLSAEKSETYISELLNKQVSLQKHAIRLSFIKIKTHDIPALFSKVWKFSKNSTIRSILFKTVHNLLCKEKKDLLGIQMLWNLLEMFMENLTFDEDKTIYETLLQIDNIPKSVAAQFFVKSWSFLKSLQVSKVEYKIYESQVNYYLLPYARKIMDTLPQAFISKILFEFINDDFMNISEPTSSIKTRIDVITCYLLSANDERTQMKKYEEIFIPIFKRCLTLVEDNKNENHCVQNLELLLNTLCQDLQQYFFKKKMILPLNMFLAIQDEIKNIFTDSENYLMLTKWGLAVSFTKSLKGHESCNDWNELCLAAMQQFREYCYQNLYEHCEKYFPRIYILFAKALKSVLYAFVGNNDASLLKILEYLLHNKDFVQGYLTTIQLYPKDLSEDDDNTRGEKLRMITEHPSLEVKMHYYNKFIYIEE